MKRRLTAAPQNDLETLLVRKPRNFRHFAEWRLFFSSRFFFLWVSLMAIVTVNFPIWNVMRIRLHLLSESVGANRQALCHSSSCPSRGFFIVVCQHIPVNTLSSRHACFIFAFSASPAPVTIALMSTLAAFSTFIIRLYHAV